MNYWENRDIKDLDGESWKPVAGYEDCYNISNYGRVKSLKRFVNTNNGKRELPEIILKQFLNRGYPFIILRKNNKPRTREIHRLVAIHFIENVDNKPCVNHIKGIKTNNMSSELEWCTYSENNYHAYRALNKQNNTKGKFGKDHHRAKQVKQVTLNGELVKVWDSMADISRETLFSKSKVCNCCKGKRKTHKGFKWEYLNSK